MAFTAILGGSTALAFVLHLCIEQPTANLLAILMAPRRRRTPILRPAAAPGEDEDAKLSPAALLDVSRAPELDTPLHRHSMPLPFEGESSYLPPTATHQRYHSTGGALHTPLAIGYAPAADSAPLALPGGNSALDRHTVGVLPSPGRRFNIAPAPPLYRSPSTALQNTSPSRLQTVSEEDHGAEREPKTQQQSGPSGLAEVAPFRSRTLGPITADQRLRMSLDAALATPLAGQAEDAQEGLARVA